jgi:hypothetical protein
MPLVLLWTMLLGVVPAPVPHAVLRSFITGTHTLTCSPTQRHG